MPVNNKTRSQVIGRAGGRCAICGRDDVPLEIDHILPSSKGGTESLSNLRAVCRSCHILLSRTPQEQMTGLQESQSRAHQLEREVSRLFAQQGFAVLVGATGPDAGTDLIIHGIDPSSGEPITIVVECKWGPRPPRRETVMQLAAYKEASRAQYALLISNQGPSEELLEVARTLGVSIIPAKRMAEAIAAFKGASQHD
jgi:Holliday junction resolvase